MNPDLRSLSPPLIPDLEILHCTQTPGTLFIPINILSLSTFSLIPFSSYACAISDGDIVVITGGFRHKTEVSVYNIDGWIKDLPHLNIGRQYHACAAYQEEDGETVELSSTNPNHLHSNSRHT